MPENVCWKTGLYIRLSREDGDKTESDSVVNHDVIYKGWFTPPKLHHDCGSFVANETVVMRKVVKPT